MAKSNETNTKAIMLAAGLGTRLRPITDSMPKCLLPIGGKPLLQLWFEKIIESGVHDVLVNTHWLETLVETFISNWSGNDLNITMFHEPSLLGSAGTIMATKYWWEDASRLLILYADNFTTVRLSDVLLFHQSHEWPFTLGIFKTNEPERCGIVDIDRDDIVIDFVEKPAKPKTKYAAGGIYVSEVSLLKEVMIGDDRSQRPYDLGRHVLPKLIGRMKAYRLPGILLDIGTPEAYEAAQKIQATIYNS